MLTVFLILAIIALICTVGSFWNPSKVPLGIAVVFLCIIELIRALPVGK
jgi:hypothetical protein